MIINKKLLAQYSPLPLPYNYDYSEVVNYVPVAQEIWIRPLIGSDLLDEIEEQVAEDNLSEENGTLMVDGFLLQYLAYATCLEALPILWANFSEVGITKGKSENSESVSLKDMTYMEGHLRRQVEVLKDSVKKFLCEHSDSFPALDCCLCGCSCCEDSKLNKPNQWQQIYTTPRKATEIK